MHKLQRIATATLLELALPGENEVNPLVKGLKVENVESDESVESGESTKRVLLGVGELCAGLLDAVRVLLGDGAGDEEAEIAPEGSKSTKILSRASCLAKESILAGIVSESAQMRN